MGSLRWLEPQSTVAPVAVLCRVSGSALSIHPSILLSIYLVEVAVVGCKLWKSEKSLEEQDFYPSIRGQRLFESQRNVLQKMWTISKVG